MFFNVLPDHLQNWLYQELVEKNKTLKEFEIISHWKKRQWLDKNCLSDSLSLFRTHFFIFHNLYHLHKKLLNQNLALHIEALQIFALSPEAQQRAPQPKTATKLDALMHFYLDWRPIFETNEAQVQKLLSFAHAGLGSPYRLQEAFKRFNLTPPTTASAIKQRYRTLASKHHPDRGGELRVIQQINEDKALLLESTHTLFISSSK